MTMAPFNAAWARARFPALLGTDKGRRAVYFDAPGGTQVPRQVIEAVSDYLLSSNANTHGAFATSRRTDAIIIEAREAMAALLGCGPVEIVFGQNMTTLAFALSRSLAREMRAGDEVVVTRLDHDANVAPWKALEEQGVTVRVAGIRTSDCTLDMNELASLINSRTRLVAAGYASNAVGSINDVAEIVRLAHSAGALAFIDAVHYAPHGPIDVAALDCDFLACSAYKFFGPHVGVLYGKREHLRRLRPYKVRPASDDLPDRWETGTQNHEGLAGIVAAIAYLAGLGRQCAPRAAGRRAQLMAAMEAIREYERSLAERLVEGLLQIPRLTLYGIADPARFQWRTPTVSIRIDGRRPQEVAAALGEQGIYVWDGNFYALGLTESLNLEPTGGLVRIGLAHYNTAGEIDVLLQALRDAAG